MSCNKRSLFRTLERVITSLGLERREENFVFVETADAVRAQGFSSSVRIRTTEFIVFEVGRFLGEYVAMMASHGDLPKFKAVFF